MTVLFTKSFLRSFGLLSLVFLALAAPPAWGRIPEVNSFKASIITDSFDAEQDEFHFASAEILGQDELADLRGGFIDPTGLIVRFAVDIKSQIDGAMTFVRSLVMDSNNRGSMQVASNTAALATEALPPDTTANVLENGKGVVVTDGISKTILINQNSGGGFGNIILNTADNLSITQTMNIDLALRHVQSSMGQLSAMKNLHAPAGIQQVFHMHRLGFGM